VIRPELTGCTTKRAHLCTAAPGTVRRCHSRVTRGGLQRSSGTTASRRSRSGPGQRCRVPKLATKHRCLRQASVPGWPPKAGVAPARMDQSRGNHAAVTGVPVPVRFKTSSATRPIPHFGASLLQSDHHGHLHLLPTRNSCQRPVPARTVGKCLRWSDELFGHDRHCSVVGPANR
jgi:hypothetical protein